MHAKPAGIHHYSVPRRSRQVPLPELVAKSPMAQGREVESGRPMPFSAMTQAKPDRSFAGSAAEEH